MADPLLWPSSSDGVYVHLTWSQLEALIEALDTGSDTPPVVGDLAAFYLALDKLKLARQQGGR